MDIALQHPLWHYDALAPADVHTLLASARALRRGHGALLRGKQVALLSDTPSSPVSRVFADAVADLGGRLSVVRPQDLRLDDPHAGGHAARLLGRLYEAVGCEIDDPGALARLCHESGIPVLRLASSALDPTRLLADLMAMQDALPAAAGPPRLCVLDTGERLAAWQHLAGVSGLRVCACAPPGLSRPERDADFVSDPAAPPCSDGHPSLQPTRPGLEVAQAQVTNHRLVLEALLARLMP